MPDVENVIEARASAFSLTEGEAWTYAPATRAPELEFRSNSSIEVLTPRRRPWTTRRKLESQPLRLQAVANPSANAPACFHRRAILRRSPPSICGPPPPASDRSGFEVDGWRAESELLTNAPEFPTVVRSWTRGWSYDFANLT